MGRFQVGWQLGLRSWGLLRRDKELVLLPVASGVIALVVLAVLALPAAILQDHAGHLTPVAVVLYAAALLMVSFVGVFFAAALVAGALQRLGGGDPTVRSALAVAWQRRWLLAQWALLSTVVGLVVRFIEQRFGVLGRVAGFVLDLAWAVASAFAIPVIVVEGVGPKQALSRSSDIVRARWGTSVGSYVGAGLILLPVYLGVLVVGLVLVAASPAVGIAVLVAGFLVCAVLAASVSGIARAALYQYATTGSSPLLDPQLAAGAFRPRRRRGRSGGSGFGGPANLGGGSGGGFGGGGF